MLDLKTGEVTPIGGDKPKPDKPSRPGTSGGGGGGGSSRPSKPGNPSDKPSNPPDVPGTTGHGGHGHFGDCPKDETCPIWPYTDSIPTAWYHDGVHYCIERSFMIGTAPLLWEPNIPLSRAMVAQVVYNKAGRPEVDGECMFNDVAQEWYWPAITWGGRNTVLLGYGNDNFGPEDPVTREQLATILWRYAGKPAASSELKFSDAATVSDYAKTALCWASEHGVITGYPDGTFLPQGNTTRAEAAQMFMRYFNL